MSSHDMDTLVAELDEVVSVARSFRDVVDLLRHIETDKTAEIDALALAFHAPLRFRHNKDQPSEFAFVDEPDSEIIARWRVAYELAADLVLQARLGDLLWTYKSKPRPDLAAQTAIDAYLELAQRWEGLEAMQCVARAADLSRKLCDSRRIEKAHVTAEAKFYETINDTSKPGISLGYLNILAFAPSKIRPNNLQPLVDRAKATFASSPHFSDDIIEIEAHIASADSAKLRTLQLERAESWERHAEAEPDPMRAYFFLRKAADFAASLPEQRSRILTKIRSTDISKLGLQEHRFEIPVDPWPLLELRDHLLNTGGALETLERILMLGPPTGDAEENLKEAKDVAEGSILRLIATELTIDRDTRQARPVESDEQRLDKELSASETRQLVFKVETTLEPILAYLFVRHPIDRGELNDWIGENGVSKEIAGLIASAMFDWWEGCDNLGVAMRLINAIEALARHRLEQTGKNVLDLASATQRGGYRPLGDILSDLRELIDESWRRYLRCVLVSEHGLNLRNRLCHGIVQRVANPYVAILVIAALYLARLEGKSHPKSPIK